MTMIRVSSKRILVFLTLLLAFTQAISLQAYAANDGPNYYSIASEDDLELIRNNPSANFDLVQDIKLTRPFIPIPQLSGDFNGNGFTISGLEINSDPNLPITAFIQQLSSKGKIRNLGLVDVQITGASTDSSHWASGMVGINNGMISNSYVTGDISGGYRSAGIAVSNKKEITDSYAMVNVSARSESAGLVAVAGENSTLTNSYAIAHATSSNSNTAILVAYANDKAKITNNIAVDGSVSNGNNSGHGRIVGKIKGSPTLLNNYAYEEIPVQNQRVASSDAQSQQGQDISRAQTYDPAFYADTLNWDLARVWKLRERPQRPVLQVFRVLQATNIRSESDLALIGANPDGDFILMNDIVMTNDFEPIPQFNGTLDGNGFSIENLSITASATQKKAAFIVENSGIIQRLGMKSVNITGLDTDNTYWASGLVARNTSEGIIRESFVTGSITGAYRSAGLVVANYGQLQDVYAAVDVQAKMESGGLVAVAQAGSSLTNGYIVPRSIHSEERNTGAIAAYAYSDATLSHTLVLPGAISNGQNKTIHRIVGQVNTAPTLINNWASSDALVQGNPVTAVTYEHGTTLASEDLLTSLSFYEDELGWDFYDVWAMSAVLDRPVLRHARENQVNLIRTVADLETMRSNNKADYQLANNITLSEPFTPIPQFLGTWDGAGFALVDLNVTASAASPKASLIIDQKGIIDRLGIVNAKIEGMDLESSQWASGLAARNYGTIRRSHVSGEITGGYRGAGLVVSNHGTIENVHADVTVIAKVESGGLVAVAEEGSVIDRTYVNPRSIYSQTRNTGGIVAYMYDNTTLTNNVVLPGNIGKPATEGAPEADANRIIGKINGDLNTMTIDHNWAADETTVHGLPRTSQTFDVRDGHTAIAASQLNNLAFYQDELNWDFDQVWKWNDRLHTPKLRQFTGWYDAPSFIAMTIEDTGAEHIVYDGTVTDVTYRKMRFIDTNNAPQQAFIIEIDPKKINYQIRVGTTNNQPVPIDGLGYYQRTIDGVTGDNTFKDTVMGHAQTTDEVLDGFKVLAGVNGEFYTAHGPEGHMIKDGAFIPGNRVPGYKQNYPHQRFFGIRKDGSAMIGNYADDWQRERLNLTQVSGAQHDLVREGYAQDYSGEVIHDSRRLDFDWETSYRHLTAHPRTAVGIKEDGTVMFVVVDGRIDKVATGMTIEQLAQFMKELDAVHATNMDGGGSSTAAIWTDADASYQMINQSSNKGGPRKIFNSLLITITD